MKTAGRGNHPNSRKNLTYSIPNGSVPWNKGLVGFRAGRRVKRILKECSWCGFKFETSPNNRRSASRKYCSRLCSYKVPKHTIPHSKESKKIMSIKKIGKRISPSTEFKRDPNTPEKRYLRSSNKYSKWRKAIFERDNYTCQMCEVRGGKLNADHIKPFSIFPELRLELSNGRTLCKECHKKTKSYGKNLITLRRIYEA